MNHTSVITTTENQILFLPLHIRSEGDSNITTPLEKLIENQNKILTIRQQEEKSSIDRTQEVRREIIQLQEMKIELGTDRSEENHLEQLEKTRRTQQQLLEAEIQSLQEQKEHLNANLTSTQSTNQKSAKRIEHLRTKLNL